MCFFKEVYHLANHWDHYPGKLIAPRDFHAPEIVSSRSNNAPIDTTRGTWRSRILAQPEMYLPLRCFSIDYSTRVFPG